MILTPASTPIATERARIIADTFAICCSLLTFITATNRPTNTVKPRTNAAPFNISVGDNMPTNLHTPTINIIENDIDNSNPPSLAIFLSLPICVALTNSLTKPMNASANAAPAIISVGSSILTSLQIPTMSPIAIAILIIMLPSLCMFLSPSMESAILPKTPVNIINATAKPAPFIISPLDNVPANLHTPTISNIAMDNLVIRAANLVTSSATPLAVIFWQTYIKPRIAPINTANPTNPPIASGRLMDPISLTVRASSPIATAIDIKPFFSPSILAPSFPIFTEAFDIRLLATAKATKTPASHVIIPAAFTILV